MLDSFVNYTGSQPLRGDIVEGFNQLRQNNQGGVELKIYVPSNMSCGKDQKESSTVLAENEIMRSPGARRKIVRGAGEILQLIRLNF